MDESVKALAEGVKRSIDRAFISDDVIGVLFCGVVTAWSGSPSAYLYKRAHHVVPNARLDGISDALKTLDNLMFGDKAGTTAS